MTDEDTINKLQSVFGVGSVLYRENLKQRKDGGVRKPTWIWSVQNRDGILKVLNSIKPHMGERRSAKINEILEYLNDR